MRPRIVAGSSSGSGGGTEPVWSRAGNELFYRRGNAFMAVPFATEPDFSPGAPRTLFEGNFVDYEADKIRRLGKDADQPHRIKYKPLVRG